VSAAAGIGPDKALGMVHGAINGFRLGKGGCRVIEVYRHKSENRMGKRGMARNLNKIDPRDFPSTGDEFAGVYHYQAVDATAV
jgi:hypothetical protein